jgi:hypothetical protein
MLQVFRRADSPCETGRFRLRGLDPEAVYEIADLDKSDAPAAMSGFELMETGVPVTMREKSPAVILKYKA